MIKAEFLLMNVDLNEFRGCREQTRAPKSQAVIDSLADNQKQVGFLEDGVHGGIECRVGVTHAERVIVRDRAFGHRDGVEGQVGLLKELP